MSAQVVAIGVTALAITLLTIIGGAIGSFMLIRALLREWSSGRVRAKAEAAARARQAQEQAAAEAAFRAKYADWETYESPVDRSYLAIDFRGERLCIGQVCAVRDYPFAALKSSELLLDGGAVLTVRLDGPRWTDPARISLLRAIYSPTQTIKTIGEMVLRITVDDPTTPIYHVTFLKVGGMGADPHNPAVREIAGVADRFIALLANARDHGQTKAPDQTSAADEIKRLWDLKQIGALTEDEFEAQKAKLLAAG